jgi:hypothetical protein
MQAGGVHQFRSHYQLITMDPICAFEYSKSLPGGGCRESQQGIVPFITPIFGMMVFTQIRLVTGFG